MIRHLNKNWFGKMIVCGEVVDLGVATPVVLSQRGINTIHANGDQEIDSYIIVVASTKQELNHRLKHIDKNRPMTDTEQFLSQLDPSVLANIQPYDPDGESPVPGVTNAEFESCHESKEYQTYAHFALHPENRIGVDQFEIEAAATEYKFKFPTISEHYPKWVDES